MRNHTTPKIWELSGPQGKTATLTLTSTSSPQTAAFQLTNIPTGKDGKFWYYCTGMTVAIDLNIDNASGEGSAALEQENLWQAVQSLQVYTPVLGTLFLHANYRGAVAGLIGNRFSLGYNDFDLQDGISTGTTGEVRTLYFRIPFACEFLKKPHEVSPWGGFFEGGTVEVRVNPSTSLQGASAGATVNSAAVRCWMDFIPAPEACIHTPFQVREHANLPGNSVRHTITDMGAPDGLQGIDQGKGVGVSHLLWLSNAGNVGLDGASTADNIVSYDIPWRDQTRIDSPDAAVASMFAMMGVRAKPVNDTADASSFPYLDSAAPLAGHLNSADSLFFPYISCGRDFETSKLQTVAGAKDINVTYGSDGTPSDSPRFIGGYFPTFDEAFVRNVLVPRITPGKAQGAELLAKTLNKQSGGVYGVGKLAYVRQKIQ
jgi:hypothetical protein